MLTELRPHQKEGVARALEYDGFGLFMEQRSGKTLTALAIVEVRKDIRKVLVVCPKRAIDVWESEINKHMGDSEVEFYIVNYEVCNYPHKNKKLATKMFNAKKKELLNYEADMVILDECHKIKHRA